MQLEVSDSIPDLFDSGLDDQITSVRVMPQRFDVLGATSAARCWTIDADNPNLKPLGANDKISSIRRLPGRGR